MEAARAGMRRRVGVVAPASAIGAAVPARAASAGDLDDDMQRQAWVVLDAMGLCDPAEVMPIASPALTMDNARS